MAWQGFFIPVAPASPTMKRLFLLIFIVSAFVYTWKKLDEIPLLVIGQPSSTGTIQQKREAPFFNNLRAKTDIPFRVTYRPLESVGFKDTHQLQMLKEGTIDLASLRFMQNSEMEPSLQGIDLSGMITDHKSAQKVIAAYGGTVDHYLQARFNAKLLGVWTFGPQEIFCNRPINKLTDIKGLKVRVASTAMGTFISELGAKPVVVSFDETKNALSLGLVDCAITSAASANFAGWPKYANYNFSIPVQFGLNGYAISLKKWNTLSYEQQGILQKAFDSYLQELWQFTKVLQTDAKACNTGAPCKFGTPYKVQSSSPSPRDIQLSHQIIMSKVLPEWGERCEKIHPGCRQTWQEKLSPYIHNFEANDLKDNIPLQ